MTWDKMKMSSDKLTKIFSYCYHMSWTDLSVKMDTPSLLVQSAMISARAYGNKMKKGFQW